MAKLLILALFMAGAAFGQCGTKVVNPLTGQLDCIGSSSGSAAGSVLTKPAFGASQTYTVSTSVVQDFSFDPNGTSNVLTGNITSATLVTTLATVGQVITWRYCQDSGGSHTVAWPSNVTGFGVVDSTALACSKQPFVWDGVNAVGIGPMVSDNATPGILTTGGLLTLPTGPDTLVARASTDTLTNKTYDTAGTGNVFKLSGTTITAAQGNTGVIMTAGTVSGTGASLCTDASGNATTSGCTGTPTGGTGTTVTAGAVSINPLDSTYMQFDERFCFGNATSGQLGQYGWIFANTGSGTAVVGNVPIADVDANHPCGVKFSNVTTSQGVWSAVAMGGSVGLTTDIFQSGTVKSFDSNIQFRISATTGIKFYIGIGPYGVIPGAFNNGCFLRFDTTLGTPDSTWTAVCADQGGTFATATIAGTLDTNIHRLRMYSNVLGTWHFSLDGGADTPITKTMNSGQAVGPFVVESNDGSNTTRYAEVFRFSYFITGLVVN